MQTMPEKKNGLLRQLPYLLIPLAMLGLFLAASLSNREDAAAPARAFVAGIYEHYSTDNGPPNLPDATLTTLMSDELLALWQQGQALSQQFNEPNATSYDPFCLCQEYWQLRVTDIITRMIDTTHAEADVSVALSFGEGDAHPLVYRLGYRLIATEDGWRVDDILAPTNQTPSLRARISDDIVSAAETPQSDDDDALPGNQGDDSLN